MDYIILNSSVFAFVKKDKVLLYDSNTNKKVLFHDEIIATLFSKRYHGLNVFAVENITSEILGVANKVEELYMGWFARNLKIAPFQPCRIPALNFDDKGNVKDKMAPVVKRLTKIASDVLKIQICVDRNLSRSSDYFQIENQTIFSHNNNEQICLDANLIKRFIPSLNAFANLFEIDIVLNNWENYQSTLELLTHFCSLSKKNINVVLYIDCNELVNDWVIDALIDMLHSNCRISLVLCLLDCDDGLVQRFKIIQSRCDNKVSLKIAIQHTMNNKDIIEQIEKMQNVSIVPFFNGSNEVFFQNNVFLTTQDIACLNPSANDVLMNQVLNANFFGKIIIDSNSNVYSRFNGNSIGKIQQGQDIVGFVEQYLQYNDNWFLTRDKVSPCSDCLFCYLCPPISNYEISFKRYNLCEYEP